MRSLDRSMVVWKIVILYFKLTRILGTSGMFLKIGSDNLIPFLICYGFDILVSC